MMRLMLDIQLFAHKKGQGSTKNGRDSISKRLGAKAADGEYVTDIPERPSPLNRNRMLNNLSSDCFEDASLIEKIDADFGNYHLYKVKYFVK